MEGVEFDESPQINSFNANRPSKISGLTNLFIKLGLVKDQQHANTLMLIISIICLALMTYFIVSTFFPSLFDFSSPTPAMSPSALQQRLDGLNNE